MYFLFKDVYSNEKHKCIITRIEIVENNSSTVQVNSKQLILEIDENKLNEESLCKKMERLQKIHLLIKERTRDNGMAKETVLEDNMIKHIILKNNLDTMTQEKSEKEIPQLIHPIVERLAQLKSTSDFLSTRIEKLERKLDLNILAWECLTHSQRRSFCLFIYISLIFAAILWNILMPHEIFLSRKAVLTVW